MYRILREHGEVRERRAQATHPAKVKPELVARAPREVYSWDITKLKGPTRGVYYDLYVMLDINQPLRRRLDRRPDRERRAGQGVHR
jgi:putative transposase